MAIRPIPSPQDIRQLLRYEPETGKLFWRVSLSNRAPVGREAFTSLDGYGYRMGRIYGNALKAHRVIWAIVHGDWPDDYIDHINGDRSDNRLDNLRAATAGQNQHNRGKTKRNTSGFKGVSWNKSVGMWGASILLDWKKKHLGYFSTPEAAHAAYCAASVRLHGEFARTG